MANLSLGGVKRITVNEYFLQVTFILQAVNNNDLGAVSNAVHAFISQVLEPI